MKLNEEAFFWLVRKLHEDGLVAQVLGEDYVDAAAAVACDYEARKGLVKDCDID